MDEHTNAAAYAAGTRQGAGARVPAADPRTPAAGARVPAADPRTPAAGAQAAGETLPVPIGAEEIAAAAEALRRYAAAKAPLDARLADDERWWELRHWESLRGRRGCRGQAPDPQKAAAPEPSSAWLFNTILNKHADVMDNYPEPVVLPRERSDEESARTLTKVLPVVLERCGFEQTYSDQGWEKLKHGTAVWGVFWDPEKDNGLGDIDVRGIDLRSIYWEPGVRDVQDSKQLFLTALADTAELERDWPQYAGRLGGGAPGSAGGRDDAADGRGADPTEKSLVVDWYYKRRLPDGRTLLHYARFCNDCLLYASENDPEYAGRGDYDHGRCPVVFDVLFPEKGSPAGFGYIAVTKDPQMYIDRLSANILETSMMAAKKRFFVSTSTNVDPGQFADWDRQLVPVEGELSDARIREIRVDPVPGVCMDVLREKIAELKDTAGNRDVNSGQAAAGVTAAAAIVALQEAGNKTSRDLIAASWRAHGQVMKLCVELMRQFYGAARSFRITGPDGGFTYTYAALRGGALAPRPAGVGAGGETLYRRPDFDLKVKAQKRSPFSRMEANERAKELYALGFFNPARAQEALAALEMMDFEGIEAVRERVRQGAEENALP